MFKNKNLSVIAYANGVTFWNYVDRKIEKSSIDFSNFFNSIWALCAIGDKISFICKDAYFEAIVVKIKDETVTIKELISLDLTNGED